MPQRPPPNHSLSSATPDLLSSAGFSTRNSLQHKSVSLPAANSTEVRMPNGLTVYLIESAELTTKNVISVSCIVPVGSSNERPAEAGFAHLLEHLWVDRVVHPPGLFRAFHRLQEAKLQESAVTSREYMIFCAAHSEPGVLDGFARFFSGVFTPLKDLEIKERVLKVQKATVIKEAEQYASNAGSEFDRHFFASRPSHVHPIAGYKETLESATIEQLEDFRQRTFDPATSRIIIAAPTGLLKQCEKQMRNAARYFKPVSGTRKVQRMSDLLSTGLKESDHQRIFPLNILDGGSSDDIAIRDSMVGFQCGVRTLPYASSLMPALDIYRAILKYCRGSELSWVTKKLTDTVTDEKANWWAEAFRDTGSLGFKGEIPYKEAHSIPSAFQETLNNMATKMEQSMITIWGHRCAENYRQRRINKPVEVSKAVAFYMALTGSTTTPDFSYYPNLLEEVTLHDFRELCTIISKQNPQPLFVLAPPNK